MKWQPIETAPKDGTWIIGFCPDPGDYLPSCGVLPAKWVQGGDWVTRGVGGIDLTHWMPLPPPPTEEAAP